jgi:spore coat protein U-like protein
MRKILTTTVAAVLAAAAGGASAVTNITTTFQVSASVSTRCTVSAAALSLGTYNPGSGTAATGSSNVTVNCTKNAPFTVALDKGTTAGGTIAQRLLTNGTDKLQYNLYTDNAYGNLFGDGSAGGGNTVTGTGGGFGVANANTVPVYGQLLDSAFNQVAGAGGPYTDTITVTLSY